MFLFLFLVASKKISEKPETHATDSLEEKFPQRSKGMLEVTEGEESM